MVERVREGSAGDIDLMDSVDRRTRGAAHGSDHLVLIGDFRLRRRRPAHGLGLRLRPPGRGRRTCWRPPTGGPPPTCCGRRSPPSSPDEPVTVAHVTAANEWAVDVGMAARLDLHQRGYLALRGT